MTIRRPIALAGALALVATGSAVATAPTAHAASNVPACGAGTWTLARKGTTGAVQKVKVKPGYLALYRKHASKGRTTFCTIFVNTSGKAQKMTVRMIAQPKPGPGSLTRKVGTDSGVFRSYAGPIKTTVVKGVRVRAFGYGPGGAWDFVESDA